MCSLSQFVFNTGTSVVLPLDVKLFGFHDGARYQWKL